MLYSPASAPSQGKRPLTAFSTPFGLYQFMVMDFGLPFTQKVLYLIQNLGAGIVLQGCQFFNYLHVDVGGYRQLHLSAGNTFHGI